MSDKPKRKHFTSWVWSLNIEPVYTVQGPNHSAIVLYHRKFKKFAVLHKAGPQNLTAYDNTEVSEKTFHFADIFEAKASAVNRVRGHHNGIIVK